MNKETLNKIYQKYEEFEKQQLIASELLRTAQDRFGETEMEVEREDGTKTKVPQKFLWKEVFELGAECEAGKALQEKHPKVFEAYEKEREITKEINKLLFTTFGIASHQKVTFKDIINVVEVIVDYKINEKN